MLLQVVCMTLAHKNKTCCSIAGQTCLASQSAFADNGSMFAFCGGAAIGHAGNAFKTMDIATALLLMQIVPMELTI